MSKESSYPVVVKRNQRASCKKVNNEISKNENKVILQCSKETVEKVVEGKKSSIKLKTRSKNLQKDKKNFTKLKATIEHNVDINLTAQKEKKCFDDKCQDVSEQIFKQEEQNTFNVKKKKKQKLQENKWQKFDKCSSSDEIIEIIKDITTNASTTDENYKQETSKCLEKQTKFLKHISEKRIDKLLKNQNPANVEYVEGYLRINSAFHKHAYLSLVDDQRDLLIIGVRDRNRAFEGDLVVARINPPEKWQILLDGQKQKTGVVVCIREKIHPRLTVGSLKKQGTDTYFYPKDKRIPLLKINSESLSKQFNTQLEDKLLLATVTNWEKPFFAIGKILNIVGTIGEISTESRAILLEHNIDVTPFSQEVIESLPNCGYILTENDIKGREDWRDECVFTIDCDTAVDLDDAVSCKLLDNGNYEIGIHISDVTYYLEFLSPLDIQVAKRATTVYMTDTAHHMLPNQLCQICSLLPGQDKLAFSVVYEITPNAKIVKHRFAKTVIKSCCQMTYQHAQKFIKNPKNDWHDDFLNITGNFNPNDLSVKVNILHNLAVQMRNVRFANGALQINQPKLQVIIDKTTGLPKSYSIEEQNDSNRLIEEFMLLANMTVATHLYNTIPETALLRNHKEPSKYVLNITKDILQKFGIHLDIESSASLHASIKRYEQEFEFESNETITTIKYRMMVINNLCSKAMNRATYKCLSTIKTREELRHYALNVPFYTHFTSPIRRYSDCIVHRLLSSTITDEALPEQWSKELCMKIAANCNLKKHCSKMAQKQSSELYFAYLVDLNGPHITMGIVLDVKEKYIDVMLCQVGIKLRVYFTKLENLEAVEYSSECSVPTISITWKQPAIIQVINVFTLLYLKIEKHPESFKLMGILLPPNQENEL
ncbi:DIS3-like exonuclease 2 [Ptiloglossa arizonensis]|uniref:DIS3-like exonuclease 2 n=1 Tax=Ptiloglossa arizonensis TaxID=3350558 RepID=UPI003FA088FA